MLAVFHTDAPPDVGSLRCIAELAFQQSCHAVSPLCENLVRVPVRRQHHTADFLDVFVRHALVEKVAHRINEDLLGLRQPNWVSQLLWHESKIEAKLKWMPLHAA